MQVKGLQDHLGPPRALHLLLRRRKRYEQLHYAGAPFPGQYPVVPRATLARKCARQQRLWFVRNGMIDYLGSDMHNVKHAHIIMDYINSKEWKKIASELEQTVKNGMII